MTIAPENPVADIADELLTVAQNALALAERPGASTLQHHIPFVPQGACCKTDPTDDFPFGTDGFLSTHTTFAFPSAGFPAQRSTSTDVDEATPPAVHIWLRLWRCFPTLDSKGNYDLDEADRVSRELLTDLAVLWAALQQGTTCGSDADDLAGRVDGAVIGGCKGIVLWEARPIRVQSGCAGWDIHLIARWIPVKFTAPEP